MKRTRRVYILLVFLYVKEISYIEVGVLQGEVLIYAEMFDYF